MSTICPPFGEAFVFNKICISYFRSIIAQQLLAKVSFLKMFNIKLSEA